MTALEFNDKYESYIEEGFCGLEFDIPNVTEFLDKIFTDLTKIPDFKVSQIKLKFHMARFYANCSTTLCRIIESEIDELVKQYDLEQESKECDKD